MERSSYERSAHLYDLFDHKEDIEFFYHYAAQTMEALDIGAGTGRVAIPLAKRGVSLVCIEPSPAMRQELVRKIMLKPDIASNIRVIAGDAQTFEVGSAFQLAVLSGCFDHFVDAEQRLSSLLNIGMHLIPGGLLVFDVFVGLTEDSPLSPSGEVRVGGREYRRFVGMELLPDMKKQIRLVFEIYEGSELVERIEEQGVVGITNRTEVHDVLAKTGFEVRREWSGYSFEEFQDGNEILIIEAVKRS